jgi:hypothetical protein
MKVYIRQDEDARFVTIEYGLVPLWLDISSMLL